MSREQLLQLRRDRPRFLHDLYNSPTLRLPDGREVRGCRRMISGSATANFCGRIGFRFQPRNRGPAAERHGPYRLHDRAVETAARLRHRGTAQILPSPDRKVFAGAAHLRRRQRGIAEKSSWPMAASRTGAVPHLGRPGHVKLTYWVPTIPPAR